jgi:asparagine synthase (glutamine-hydrolysing)
MRHVEPNLEINTFSYIAQGSKRNEESWVNIVNQHVGAVAHKVVISPQELVKDLDDMIKFQGEPFGSTSIYAQYRVYRLAKESGIKVTLDGQGADELFAGYQGYPEWKIRSLLSDGKVFQAQKFLIEWSNGPGRSLRMGLENSISVNLPKFLVPLAYSMRRRTRKNILFDQNILNRLNIKTVYPINYQSQIGWDRALVARLRHALTSGELSQLLRHGDRNSMRWSIESRVPFLTNDFAEYVLTLPEEFLLSKDGTTKYIFRKAMKGIVPDEILQRKDKIGFETPEFEWLKSLNHNINEWLDDLSSIPWINLDQAKVYFTNVLMGNTPFSWQTWRLINAARWTRLVLNR